MRYLIEFTRDIKSADVKSEDGILFPKGTRVWGEPCGFEYCEPVYQTIAASDEVVMRNTGLKQPRHVIIDPDGIEHDMMPVWRETFAERVVVDVPKRYSTNLKITDDRGGIVYIAHAGQYTRDIPI